MIFSKERVDAGGAAGAAGAVQIVLCILETLTVLLPGATIYEEERMHLVKSQQSNKYISEYTTFSKVK